MSCLRLGLRLPLPRRAWKMFTSKLQKKLPIFRLSKPRNHHRILGPTKGSTYPVQYKARKLTQQSRRHRSSRNPPPRRFEFKKTRHAPVFVDKLYYKEGSGVRKLINIVDKSEVAGTSSDVAPKEEEHGRRNNNHGSVGADDMWESVAMASPQMHEIDERAEEFITKFRAEMLHQESMAKQTL